MAAKRILIVEDQSEVRRMLVAWLETVEGEIEVLDAPSGEEAMLLSNRKPVDLLIADVRLAGITGLELMRKIKVSNPFLKVILITGLTDPATREQVSQSGADAYFYKPLEMGEFMAAIQHLLDAGPEVIPVPPPGRETTTPLKTKITLANRLAKLRQELRASGVMLLNDRGQTFFQTGNLQERAHLTPLIPDLLAEFNAASRISMALGEETPRSLAWFHGEKYDVYIALIGAGMRLVALINPTPEGAWNKEISLALYAAAGDMLKMLREPSANPEEDEPAAQPAPPQAPSLSPIDLEQALKRAKRKLRTRELEAFWDSAIDNGGMNGSLDGDALTYDQARDRGLAPDENP